MAIDHSIYFQQQAPDFVGSLSKGLTLSSLVDERKKAKALGEAIKGGIVSNPDGSSTLDKTKTLSSLVAGVNKGTIDPNEYLKTSKAFSEHEALEKKNRVEAVKNQYEYVGNAARQVNDLQTYQMFLQGAKDHGLDVSMYSPNYDENDKKKLAFYGGMALTKLEDLKAKLVESQIEKTKADTKKIKGDTTGAPGGGPGKITETQSKAIGFGRRAQLADQMLAQVMSDPNSDVTSLKTQIKSGLPKWLGGAKSDQEQSLNVAKTAFISSVLRKESGAAVTPQEFEQYDKIYFPQPGDTPNVLRDKQQLRANFVDTEKMTAGKAWREPVASPNVKQQAAPAAGEVERQTQDGRVAIFDSKTKQFLRYK